MRAVDTNVLVRLVTGDPASMVPIAESFVADGAWASHVVLLETVWVCKSVYGFDEPRIATMIESLLQVPALAIQEPEVVRAALVHFKARPTLKFTDCMILEIARRAGHLPLGTFDKRLAKLPGAQVLGEG